MLAIIFLNRMSMKRRAINASKQKEKLNKIHKSCCRTCLNNNVLVDIFPDKETEKKRSEDLKIVTGLEIKYNDGLSQKMCSKCIHIMNLALQFRKRCRKAEKSLLDLALGTRDTVKKNNSKSLSLKKKSRVEKQKVTEDEIVFNYSGKQEPLCDNYNDTIVSDAADDWQNDDDTALVKNEDYHRDYDEGIAKTKPKLQFSKKSASEAKKSVQKKRTPIPNNLRCDTCNKEFRMKATYKAHMRFHTNYCVCETCGKRCRNNNQLQEHKRARHGLGKIHKCAYCEYSSATKEALTIHERRHTGERPYICDHCGATFHRRSNLVQHIAIHLPEKNFQCDMCPKRLKSRKFLQIHKHNAHTGKRYGYLCAICSHRFEKPNKVRAHTRRVHGLPDDQQAPIVRVQM